jgi:hypothetical protein
MGRPLKIKKTTTKDIGFNNVGSLTNPVYPETLTTDNFFGVVGGTRSTAAVAYPVTKVIVNVDAGTGVEDGVILRQKGSTKYLVLGDSSGVTGVCSLVDDATPAINQMCIQMAASSDSTLINIKRLTNRWVLDYSDNRYVINFFSDEGSQIKSGTIGVTNDLAQIESFTST